MRCKFDLRKYCLPELLTWNSLPDNVILADNVNQFKNRLDKHWKMHDIVFNYQATLLKPEVWHELIRIVKIKRFK